MYAIVLLVQLGKVQLRLIQMGNSTHAIALLERKSLQWEP